jgi:hypothetical protein
MHAWASLHKKPKKATFYFFLVNIDFKRYSKEAEQTTRQNTNIQIATVLAINNKSSTDRDTHTLSHALHTMTPKIITIIIKAK